MSTFKEFRTTLAQRLPQSDNLDVFHIHTTKLESILEEAKNHFQLPIEDIRFEIKNISDAAIIKNSEYDIIAYPVVEYTYVDDITHTIKNINGEFFLRKGKGNYFLMVTSSEHTGVDVTLNEVMHYLQSQNIDYQFDKNLIKEIVNNKESKWITIGKFPHNEMQDSEININIAKGDMVASIFIKPAGLYGADPTVGDINQILKNNGIVYGIKEELIKRLEQKPIYQQWLEVAVGDNPEDGENAKIVIVSDAQKEDKNSKASHYKKHGDAGLKTVHKGNVVAIKQPLTQGKEGKTIFGEILFANPGNDIVMEGNQNVVISPDNKKATALVDGSVYIKSNRVFVDKLLIVENDLTMEIGDINFSGSVLIRGNVPIEIKINVEGNLSILGSVSNASITVGGNLYIANGMHGKGSGFLDVKGSLVSRFLENVNVKVGDICLIEESIINVNIICMNRVIVIEGKGQITSSTITAANEILVKSVGAEHDTSSELIVVSLPEDREKYNNLQNRKNKIISEMESIKNFFGNNLQKEVVKNMSDQQKQMVKEKLIEIKKLQVEIKKITAMLNYLNNKFKNIQGKNKISVMNKIRSGTKVTIDDKSKIIRNDLTGTVFTYKNEEIINRTFNLNTDGVNQIFIDKIISNVKF